MSLSDDDLRAIVIIFHCYSPSRLWTEVLKFVVCIGAEMQSRAWRWNNDRNTQATDTDSVQAGRVRHPQRAEPRKTLKKRETPRGLLAPKIWNQMTQRHPIWKMILVRLSSHRSTPQLTYKYQSSTLKPNKIHQLAVYLIRPCIDPLE